MEKSAQTDTVIPKIAPTNLIGVNQPDIDASMGSMSLGVAGDDLKSP
jgi:hypothetical protein